MLSGLQGSVFLRNSTKVCRKSQEGPSQRCLGLRETERVLGPRPKQSLTNSLCRYVLSQDLRYRLQFLSFGTKKSCQGPLLLSFSIKESRLKQRSCVARIDDSLLRWPAILTVVCPKSLVLVLCLVPVCLPCALRDPSSVAVIPV